MAPEDVHRFSFRLAGSTGKWNPLREPPRVIQSGDQINLYCHSVGVGPYASISKPPAEASPVVYAKQSKTLFVPVQGSAFDSDDRNLIQQYDNGKLGHHDREAFEKMGLITSDRLAPGPTQTIEKTKALGFSGTAAFSPLDFQISASKRTTTEYTIIDGKKERVDYQMLQKPKYKQLDLDWGHARQTYFSSIYDQRGVNMESRVPATFTVLFE